MAQLLLTGTELISGSSLDQALQLVDDRLGGWASNSDTFNDLLLEVFRVQSSDATAALQASICGSGLEISLQVLAGATLSGINGAYTSTAPQGGEAIYLNAAWLQSATAKDIEAVLLEEIGHAIDTRLNGTIDTSGDEGEIFSARLRNTTPATAAFSENDQRFISLNGMSVAIEASADTIAPTGSLISTAPAYAAPVPNAFGISYVGTRAKLALADIDSDGDLDLFISGSQGTTSFLRNTGSARFPAYASPTAYAFGISHVGYDIRPALADIDADGDLDLFIGNSHGNTIFLRNTGSYIAPAYAAASTNPFGVTPTGGNASPTFADIDADGDLDLFIGDYYGNTLFFRNTGSDTAPAYEAAATNPFSITDVGSIATPTFADIDADGDLDLFIGNYSGDTLFFRNTGSDTAPAYDAAATNPFSITTVGDYASPALADIDRDGDLDLFIGNGDGNTLFFLNTAATPVAPVSSTTPNGTYGIGDVITLTVQFSETVLVTGTPRLQLATGGNTYRYATYTSGSGSDTLSFTYTVQAGDTSADLDQLSTDALNLNGGTIQDAAGNNAILTLAAPGATGSLAANAQLVIDGIGPTGSLVATPVAPVSSTTPNGTYGIGAVITLTVQFSEDVLVDITGGTPRLQLETGSTDRYATYISGSGTNTLSFQYTVQAGDTSADLDQLSANALTLNGGTIKDAEGNNAILTLAAPGATGSLAANKALVIDAAADTTAPATDNVGIVQGTVASADTIAPTGSLISTAPAYAAPVPNAFGISYVGTRAKLALADIDSDGDLDLFISGSQGTTSFLRNTGSARFPAYASPTAYAFGISHVGYDIRPALADIDADGDLDLFIGNSHGNTIFLRNTGSYIAPAYAAASTNPFGVTPTGGNASPTFADIDADGDLDLFIGDYYGNTLFFRNTGSDTAPAYKAASTNPFSITDVGSIATPTFADIDADGDLDLFIGNYSGDTLFFRNTGSDTAPAYDAAATNPFSITTVGDYASPALADIDRDGDLDLFIGNGDGNTLFFLNTAATPVAPVSSTTPNGTYGIGDVITLTVQFSETVLVTGTPRLQLATGGNSYRFATYTSGSGSDTLSFTYTVQAGDTSADLDQLSTDALNLNGGTIQDAAGNNAILTLAAPGATGSLAANAQLVIDGIGPTGSLVATPVAPVSSTTPNGTYGIGAVITLTVQFSEDVLVDITGGTPRLQLETGSTDRYATYISGSGTNTLSFQYTVQAGDTSADLDQLSADALTLNGGSIQDAAGNNAILTLAAPGATGSLAANKALVINGVAPTLQNSTPADGATNVGLNSNFVLNFSETVVAGSGLISLYQADGILVESFNVANGLGSAGGSVGFSGSAVTVNPFADLVRDSGYYLQVADTAVRDGVGNSYAGIGDATSLNFNTAPVTLSVGSITVSESSLYAVVAVAIDAPISGDLSFTPSLLSGTAGTGVDTGSTIWAYVGGSWVSAASGVTLAAGSTSVLLRVAINNDIILEGLESFQFSTGTIGGAGGVALTNAAGASGTVTIADEGSSAQIFDQDTNSATPLIRSADNDAPSVAVSSVIVSEASPKAVLQVSLSNPSNFPISFTPYLQSGSATIGSDTGSTLEVFNGSSWEAAGLVSFAAGVTSRLLRVAIVNDSDYEGSESFSINTGAITGNVANSAGASGTVTIRDNGSSSNTFLDTNNSATPTAGTADNDTPPLPALSAAVLSNGNETGPVATSFRISRTGSTTGALVVTYRLGGNAIAGSDYTNPAGFDAATGLGTVTILAGQSSVDLSVPTLDDSVVDGNRSLSLLLQSSLTYTIAAATATASILDNDVAAPVVPTFVISSASVVETDTGSNPTVNLIVSLSGPAATSVSVRVRTLAASSGSSATGGSDYTAISDKLLTFVPGATSQLLAIQLLGDNTIESTESFRIELFNAIGANLPAAAATIEIVDNDSSKSLTINNSAATTPQTFSGGQYADVLIGGSAGDTINGDPAGLIGGGDAITGGPGADILTGGPGADRFRYGSFSDSTLNNTDRIRDLTLTGSDQDRIALVALPSALWNTGAINPSSPTLASAVAAAFADKDVITNGNQALAGGEAVLFAYDSTPGNSRTRQWFVAVNNGTAGFSATDDLLINVTGLASSFANGSLTPNLLFATL